MSTHVPGFQSFFRFFASIVMAKLATSSIRVKCMFKSLDGGMKYLSPTIYHKGHECELKFLSFYWPTLLVSHALASFISLNQALIEIRLHV